jgi:hypothetical protein
MPIVINFPVLAADAWGTLISIAFLVIAFIGWIMNLVNNQNQPPAPADRGRPRRPPRPQERKLQSEIDLFLEEVSGRRPEAAQIEVFEPPAEEADTHVSAMNEPRPPKPRRKPVGSGIKQRQMAGSGQLEHGLRDQMAERRESRRLADTVKRQQEQGSSSRAESHMSLFRDDADLGTYRDESQVGTFRDDEAKAVKQQALEHLQQQQIQASSLAALLRNPAGMRQAIVLSEILMRPRSMQNR